MDKILYIILIMFSCIHAKDVKPSFTLTSNGFVNDFVLDGSKLYVANDEGSVEVFDLNSRKLIKEIFIRPTVNDVNETITSKVLSVDRLNGKTLIVSSTVGGYRNVWLHDGVKLHNIVNIKKKMSIKKARFIDDENFLFGTLGYELIRFDRNDTSKAYVSHVEESAFSDLVLSEDKKTTISACESGQVTISDVKTGKILAQPKALNLDNIYRLAYKNGTILTAGQDRRVGVYPKGGKPYFIKNSFLIYCVGLSPSGKIGLYSSDEENRLQLFDVKTASKKDRLLGMKAIPSTIKFFDEVGVFAAGYEREIYYWHLD